MIFKIQQRKRNSDNKYGFNLERTWRYSTHNHMQKNMDSGKSIEGSIVKSGITETLSQVSFSRQLQQHAAYCCKGRAKEWVDARWITRGRKRRLAACRIYYKHLCPRTKNTKNTGLFPHAVNGTGDHKAGESRRQRSRRVRAEARTVEPESTTPVICLLRSVWQDWEALHVRVTPE